MKILANRVLLLIYLFETFLLHHEIWDCVWYILKAENANIYLRMAH